MSVELVEPAGSVLHRGVQSKHAPGIPTGIGKPVAKRSASPSLALLLLLSTALPAQDYRIDFHTIDGGGEILSESADQRWQLSGTLGQWDSTEALELAGGGYTLTGGFWPVNIEQTDLLFRDGFEG